MKGCSEPFLKYNKTKCLQHLEKNLVEHIELTMLIKVVSRIFDDL